MLGICEYVWSVFDLERAARPFVEVGGYQRIPLPDAPAEQWVPFGLRQSSKRVEQCLLIPPAETSGRAFRVVRFHGVEQQLVRPSQHIWDVGGFCGFDVMCRDTRSIFGRLQREHGWTAWGEPVRYKAGDADCTLVVALSPDGIALGLLQLHAQATAAGDPPAISWMFNCNQIVADLKQGCRFYGETLGWRQQSYVVIDDAVEPGHQVLGIPMPLARHTPRNIVVYAPEDAAHSSAELFYTPEMQGTNFAANAVAPNVGLLVMRVRVADARKYYAEIVGRGGIPEGEIEVIVDARLGAIARFVLRTPDGALIEIFSEQ